MNLPGLDKPSQPLTAIYGGAYAQDVWRPKTNLSVTIGLRFDVPVFENTAYLNPNANALTFRDEDGQPVQYDSGQMPGANILWSPRLGFNYDVSGDQKTQLRGGTGVFTGQPLYVWISNQLGNTGMLQGGLCRHGVDQTPASSRSRPTSTATSRQVTGSPAASYELNVTDNDFRFPQVWRSNIAVDRRLPGGITGTAEFIYNRDVNGIYYINANLPAAQTAYRRRRQPPALDHHAAHQQRDRQPGHERDRAEEPGHRPQLEPRVLGVEADVARPGAAHRLQLRRGEEHDRSGLNGRRVVEQQRHARRSRTTRASATPALARPSLLPVGVLHQAVLRAGARPRFRGSGRSARSATPATSSRQTPTATARVERSDLHPARHGRR